MKQTRKYITLCVIIILTYVMIGGNIEKTNWTKFSNATRVTLEWITGARTNIRYILTNLIIIIIILSIHVCYFVLFTSFYMLQTENYYIFETTIFMYVYGELHFKIDLFCVKVYAVFSYNVS